MMVCGRDGRGGGPAEACLLRGRIGGQQEVSFPRVKVSRKAKAAKAGADGGRSPPEMTAVSLVSDAWEGGGV